MDVPAEIVLEWGLQRMENFYIKLKEISYRNQMKGMYSAFTSTPTQWDMWSTSTSAYTQALAQQQQIQSKYQQLVNQWTYSSSSTTPATTSTLTSTGLFGSLTKAISGK